MRVNDTESKKVKRSFYEDIGVMKEFPSVYLKLKGEGNLDFFSSLHKHRIPEYFITYKTAILSRVWPRKEYTLLY